MTHADRRQSEIRDFRAFRYDRRRPVVVVEPGVADGDGMRMLADQADGYGWRILDLDLTGKWVPDDPPPIGALVRYPHPTELTERLLALKCPFIRVGMLPNPQDHEIPAVVWDQEGSGRIGAEHLASRGFRNFGYVANAPFRDGKPIFDAFHQRIKKLGFECHLINLKEIWGTLPEKFEYKVQELLDWLSGLPKPIGIMTYSDRMAARICYVCQIAGLAVPEQIAVLGTGNNRMICELAPVSISSIDHSRPNLGVEGLRLLHRILNGAPPPDRTVVVPPAGVVVRHSTDVLAVQDVRVSKAIRYMWDHLDLELSVTDIAVEAGASRRSLERAFQKELGRGIGEELRRKRMERCCELLINTDLTVAEILPMVGLASKAYLHRVFLKTFGVTPSQYRKKHTSPVEDGE